MQINPMKKNPMKKKEGREKLPLVQKPRKEKS